MWSSMYGIAVCIRFDGEVVIRPVERDLTGRNPSFCPVITSLAITTMTNPPRCGETTCLIILSLILNVFNCIPLSVCLYIFHTWCSSCQCIVRRSQQCILLLDIPHTVGVKRRRARESQFLSEKIWKVNYFDLWYKLNFF